MNCACALDSYGKWEISIGTIRNQKLDEEALKFLSSVHFHIRMFKGHNHQNEWSPDFLELIYISCLDNTMS